jgi:hypothetical protein
MLVKPNQPIKFRVTNEIDYIINYSGKNSKMPENGIKIKQGQAHDLYNNGNSNLPYYRITTERPVCMSVH